MDNIVLKISGLSKSYSGIKVLNNVSFDLREGEVHALVGENGAGKTTLIKIIAGVEKPDKGYELTINKETVNNLTPEKSIGMGISVVYQDISLFPNLSVAENICMGLFNDKIVDWKKIRTTAQKTLIKMGFKDINENTKLGDLSIGKQQIVALARALTLKSKIIIMDEPTSSLSESEVGMLYNIIAILKKENISVIYISHKLDEVIRVADRISVLRDGNMISTKNADEFDNQTLISAMVGRQLSHSSMRNEKEVGEKIFEVSGLTKEPIFRDISFSLNRNEILGITGLVGAGRSEMAQTIYGLIKKDKGTIFMNGREIVIKTAYHAIRKGICYLPEDRINKGVFLSQSIAKNITVARLDKMLDKFGLLNYKKESSIAGKYIEELNIKPKYHDVKAEKLSGGNQQKVLFSRWLNAEPKILIADEPSSGVDVGAKTEIYRLLRELASSGVGIILISSDLNELLTVSDRILIMSHGQIVDEVFSNTTTQEYIIRKGLDA